MNDVTQTTNDGEVMAIEADGSVPGNRTKVRVRTDSGDTHTGYLTEEDLQKVRDALDGKIEKSISITLYAAATDGKNEHLQVTAKKIESVKLL